MFKILVLQALYSLSDETTEFQIKDWLSFQRFLGLGLDGTVPDATRVWLFRERLVKAQGIDRLLASPQGLFARQRFLGHKRNMGYATRFNRAIGSLSGWNSPAGSRLACSQR